MKIRIVSLIIAFYLLCLEGELVQCKQCYDCVTRKRVGWPQCTQTSNSIEDCGGDRITCDSGHFRLIQTYLYPEQWDFKPNSSDSYCLNGSRVLSPPPDKCVSLSQLQTVYQDHVDSYTITDGKTGEEVLGEIVGTACFCQTWPCKKRGIVDYEDVTTKQTTGTVYIGSVTESPNTCSTLHNDQPLLYLTASIFAILVKLWILNCGLWEVQYTEEHNSN